MCTNTLISKFRSKLYGERYFFMPINIIPCLAGLCNFSHLFHPIYYVSAGHLTTRPKSNSIRLAHNRNGPSFNLKTLTGWKRIAKTRVVWWIWRKLRETVFLKRPNKPWRREVSFLSTLGRAQPSSWLLHEAGMQLLVPRLEERKCSWRRGRWQSERKDAWGWPCARVLHSLSLLSLCGRGALPIARMGRRKIQFGCEGEQGGEKHCRKFVRCFRWRAVWSSGGIKGKKMCTQTEQVNI